jgi:molecular chaperone Hsp33
VFDGIEYDIFDEFDCGYRCTCSREKYLSALRGLTRDDRDELVKEGKPIEAVCHFCGKKYVFDVKEVIS